MFVPRSPLELLPMATLEMFVPRSPLELPMATLEMLVPRSPLELPMATLEMLVPRSPLELLPVQTGAPLLVVATGVTIPPNLQHTNWRRTTLNQPHGWRCGWRWTTLTASNWTSQGQH